MEQSYEVTGDGATYRAAHMFERPPFEPSRTALVVVDMLNRCCLPDVGLLKGMIACGVDVSYYLERVHDVVVPNLSRLIAVSRDLGVKVVFVKGGSYNADFRDCTLQFKINFREWNAVAGSYEM